DPCIHFMVTGETPVWFNIYVVKGICYRQIWMSISSQVGIQMVPAAADIIIDEIDCDSVGLRCRDSSGGGSGASHPFPPIVTVPKTKTLGFVANLFHRVVFSCYSF